MACKLLDYILGKPAKNYLRWTAFVINSMRFPWGWWRRQRLPVITASGCSCRTGQYFAWEHPLTCSYSARCLTKGRQIRDAWIRIFRWPLVKKLRNIASDGRCEFAEDNEESDAPWSISISICPGSAEPTEMPAAWFCNISSKVAPLAVVAVRRLQVPLGKSVFVHITAFIGAPSRSSLMVSCT